MLNKYIFTISNEEFDIFGLCEAMAKAIFIEICEKYSSTKDEISKKYWNEILDNILNNNYKLIKG